MSWGKRELEFIENNIHLKPAEIARKLGKKVTQVNNRIGRSPYLKEKRAEFEEKFVKKNFKNMTTAEMARELGRSDPHVIEVAKSVGAWEWKIKTKEQTKQGYSDLIFRKKERFKSLCKVEMGRKCQVIRRVKNDGERIFEGDVLLSVDEELGNMYAEVVFEKGAFLIKEPGYDAELFLGEELGDFEIVGNVFENKELLEVE